MADTTVDDEIQALQAVLDALEPLDGEARGRVFEYVLKRLGMLQGLSVSTTTAPASRVEDSPSPSSPEPSPLTDIRSLRQAKQPSSAVEMAAVVAYYLSELAPDNERREAISTADLERYFKQAQYRLPQRLNMTLHNAVAAGYFDRPGRGKFRLNPVGFNLVTHGLPRSAGQAASRPPTRKRTAKKAPSKSTKK